MATKTREAFVPTRLKYTINETEYEIKLTSSFNFNELSKLAEIEDDMQAILDEAQEDGAVDDEGNLDMTRVKFALPFVNSTLRVIQIHFQDAITLEELQALDADQIADIREYLEEAQEEIAAEQEKKADQKAQRQLIAAKKNSGTTS